MLKNLFPVLLIFLSACSFSGQRGEIVVIDLRQSGMSFEHTRQMVTIASSARIAFKDDMELYINYTVRHNLESIKDNDSNVVDEKVKSIDTVYRAFIKRKGQAKGISYAWDSAYIGIGTVFNADSLWATFPFYWNEIEKFSIDIGKPVEVIEQGGKRIEKYAMPQKIGGVDSIYRYFDKSLLYIPYSFSKKYDKLRNSKLFKIQFVMNEIPKGLFIPDMAIPRRELFYEMNVTDEKNIKPYIDLLKKFQEDSNKLHLR